MMFDSVYMSAGITISKTYIMSLSQGIRGNKKAIASFAIPNKILMTA